MITNDNVRTWTMMKLHEVDWSTLPIPEDDGGASHLAGLPVPSIPLPATDGATVDLRTLPGRVVIYLYPRTGKPGVPLPEGWDVLPGARGCTPQACAFRDHFEELRSLGVERLFGLSTQDTEYQREAAQRLHLSFLLLSDADLRLATAMRLPTFEVEGMTLLKRLTLFIEDAVVQHVFYPVFPPGRSVEDVVRYLATREAGR